MRKFDKYKNNLKVEGNRVISYNTCVGYIIDNKLKVLDWEVERDYKGKPQIITKSPTTTKHLNYVANQLNLILETPSGNKIK